MGVLINLLLGSESFFARYALGVVYTRGTAGKERRDPQIAGFLPHRAGDATACNKKRGTTYRYAVPRFYRVCVRFFLGAETL